ncbi:hypothetical protein Ocin01_12712 [Orchesella cincta]|uniref:F-box domain-containing protein n=1 Tax=Orchesella cincta TaxID=48709 RepID=A0A1D2MLT7_ORCCI|nr:hypothetical protein Ocin01_12712 [Orchesella cincta]
MDSLGCSQAFEPTVSSLIRIYEKLAHCKYEKQCSIAKLNPEALAPILCFLNTEDRKRARITCKSFKESIDQHVGIHVNLDQRKIDAQRCPTLPPPGASSLRIWSLRSPQYLDHVLKRWHLISEVQFAGQINLSAITKILTRCRNLIKLSFTDRCHMYASIMPVRSAMLHTLDLGCPGYSSDYMGDDCLVQSLWHTYEMLLRKLSVPNLKVFRIFFCCVENCSILHTASAQIFRFVSIHPSIEELSLNLNHRYERFNFLANDVNYRRFRVDVPKKILRRIQLERIHLETMEPAFKIWDHILPGQKFVTHLDILNRGRRWFYFSKIISNNFATLVDIRLHNISPRTTQTTVIDVEIFSECQLLETLFLSRFINSTQEIVYCYSNGQEFPFLETESSKTAEITNLNKLPVSLRSLHIQGLVVSTAELHETLENLKNLQLLELQLCGYHHVQIKPNHAGFGEDENLMNDLIGAGDSASFDTPGIGYGVGITSSVIQTIFAHCRQLDTLFIEEFENEWTKIRNTELGDIIEKLSIIPEDGYFEDGAYYGVLICKDIQRNTGKLTRSERMQLWDVRLSQYYNHQEHKNLDSSPNNFFPNECLQKGEEFPLPTPISATSLLEILDKENGQLEQIHRMLNSGTPTSSAGGQLDIQPEEMLNQYVRKYCTSQYSAIPNYHKATRQLELVPPEKFQSSMSLSNTRSTDQISSR